MGTFEPPKPDPAPSGGTPIAVKIVLSIFGLAIVFFGFVYGVCSGACK